VLDMGGKQESVSVDRLKPHAGTVHMEVATPLRRGRPPGTGGGGVWGGLSFLTEDFKNLFSFETYTVNPCH
jgi:hypothetical protein